MGKSTDFTIDYLKKMQSPDERVERFKIAFAEKVEEVAVEHAESIGFNYKNEKHGLFRAMCMVLSKKNLVDEAIRRAKEVAGIGSGTDSEGESQVDRGDTEG